MINNYKKYFDIYPSWDANRDWVMADENIMARDRAILHEKKYLEWNAMPSPEVLNEIVSLRFRVSPSNYKKYHHIPEVIHQFSSLRYLSIPLDFVKSLDMNYLPVSLQVLEFNESSGTSSATIPKDLVLPSILEISSVSNYLTFRHENFPNLRRVNLKLKQGGRMVQELLKYSSLEWLHLGALHHQGSISELQALNPTYLGLFGCDFSSLDGIENLLNLKIIWLHTLGKLSDINALSKAKTIEDINILYCNKLKDLSPVLNVPELKALNIIGCDAIKLDNIKNELQSLDLVELAITGKVHL